jgi:Transglycosylase SLT domain
MIRHAVVGVSIVFAGLSMARAEDGVVPPTPAAVVEPLASQGPEGGTAAGAKPADDGRQTVCGLIEAAAKTHRLPVGFFTRLIWKESRFRSDALSPKGAEGIAQFMPGTAARRKVADPFDPIEAIAASAHYLRDLTDQFGNLGLAAAAYNSGETRVESWLAGNGGLPYETRDYVLSITGHTAEEWNADDGSVPAAAVEGEAGEGCLALAAKLATAGAGSALVDRIEKANWAPWGAQVAGNFSLNRAMASYRRLQQTYRAILGDQPPMVLRSVNRSRGSAALFQIRVPAQSRDEAAKVCGRLQAAGGACIVLKTGK